ncbi:hypothetical protein PSPO01_15612 [Paraphaeosphaeria sporulosa]
MVSWRNLFVSYAVMGVVALWGSMLVNGTLDAIDTAKASSELPSGRILLTSITGVPLIDGALATLVAFFDGITNGSVLQSHLLMVDLLAVIQCATIWLMVDGFSLQEFDPFVRSPASWGVGWNAIGMAVVLPVYCAFRVGTPYSRDSGLSIGDSYALFFSSAVSFVPGVLMGLPPLKSWSTHQQQVIILLYQFTPVIFSVTQMALARFINQFQYKLETNASCRTNAIRVYIVAAVGASIGHLYVMVRAISLGLLGDVFVPRPASLGRFPADRLTAGAHLFTQYDFIISALAILTWIWSQMSTYGESFGSKPTLMIASVLSTVVLGPGATLMFALWARDAYVTPLAIVEKKRSLKR